MSGVDLDAIRALHRVDSNLSYKDQLEPFLPDEGNLESE